MKIDENKTYKGFIYELGVNDNEPMRFGVIDVDGTDFFVERNEDGSYSQLERVDHVHGVIANE